MKTGRWIWFFALLSILLFVGCTKNPEKLSKRELFREAHKYMDEGDYEKALIYLDYLLENEPDEEEAYFDAAEVYLELDDEEAAYDVIYDGIEQFEDQKEIVVELIEHIIDLDSENSDNEAIKELESLLETVEAEDNEADVETDISETDTAETDTATDTDTNEAVSQDLGRSEYLASVSEGKLDVLEYGIGDNLNDLRTGRPDYEADDYFIGGPYLAYEDLSVLGDPIMYIFYFGTESSNGIKRGMSVDEVKGVLGEPDFIRYPRQENNEMDELFGGNEMLYFYNSGEYQMVLIFNVVDDGVASIGIQGKER